MNKNRREEFEEAVNRLTQIQRWEGRQEQYELQQAGNCDHSCEARPSRCAHIKNYLKACAKYWQDCPLAKKYERG